MGLRWTSGGVGGGERDEIVALVTDVQITNDEVCPVKRKVTLTFPPPHWQNVEIHLQMMKEAQKSSISHNRRR